MLNYDLSRMRYRAIFGKATYGIDPETHMPGKERFKPMFAVWCGPYSQTQTQTQIALGMKLEVDTTIVIRHNDKASDENVFVRYRGGLYKIAAINSDDRLNAFDVISLVKSSKELPDE